MTTDISSTFKCMTCGNFLIHRYACNCNEHHGECVNNDCVYWFCITCNSEEKVSEQQIIEVDKKRGNDVLTQNGDKPMPDDKRHWSEKEKNTLTSMLKKIASPDAVWLTSEELATASSPSIGDLNAHHLKQINEMG